MEKVISYVMNTLIGEVTRGSELMSLISDYDYCQFGIDKGNGSFFFFELKIRELCDNGNQYVQSLYDKSTNSWDMDKFIEDYADGVNECVSLFENDDNWNYKEIELKDNGNDKEQLLDLLTNMYIKSEAEDLIETHIDTARYYAAREIFYDYVDNF